MSELFDEAREAIAKVMDFQAKLAELFEAPFQEEIEDGSLVDMTRQLMKEVELHRTFLGTMPHGLGQYEEWKAQTAVDAAGDDA